MKILSVSDFYPPVVGGMERHVQTLSRAMVRRGHSVAVVALAREGSPRAEVDQGVRIHRIGSMSQVLKPFYQSPERPFHPTVPDPGAMLELSRILRAEAPDVIHGRGWIIYSLLASRATSKAAVVVTLHDYGLVCIKKTYSFGGAVCAGPGYRKCISCATDQMSGAKAAALATGLRSSHRLHGRVDRYIALNRDMAASLSSRLGTRGRPVHVIPSLIPDDAAEIGLAAARPAFVPAGDYLLYVGGSQPTKGLGVLLRAYQSLTSPPPLVAILTPPVLGLTQLPRGVIIVEGAPHKQVMAAWAHAILGLVPSVWAEPFGQVAVEAMATGTPVIASCIGGLKDIVRSEATGLLVRAGDAEALSAAMVRLLNDPATRSRMGIAGRARARQFFASQVAIDVEDVYRQAIADRDGRRRIDTT